MSLSGYKIMSCVKPEKLQASTYRTVQQDLQGCEIVREQVPVSRIPTITSSPYFKCIWEDGCSICECRLRPMKSQLLVVWSCSILLLNTDMTSSVSDYNEIMEFLVSLWQYSSAQN